MTDMTEVAAWKTETETEIADTAAAAGTAATAANTARAGADLGEGPLVEPRLALTFDDVSIVPGLAEVHPSQVDLRTVACRGIPMNIPILAAAMDTVTESRLAIAVAREGGVGVTQKTLPIDTQADEVDKVKRSEAGMIVDPVTMRPDQSIREALTMMSRYKISGVPVTDADGHLVGILTNRDLRFENRS